MPAMTNQQRFLSLSSVWLSYVLHVLIVTAPLAALINALCIREYKRHWCEPGARQNDALLYVTSHHQWMLTTFVTVFFMVMVTIGALTSGLGIVVALAAALWWLYRMVKGVAELMHHRAVPLAVEWSCNAGKVVQ
jgi:uncharacterized membrane protein